MKRSDAVRGMKVYQFEILSLNDGRSTRLAEYTITMLGPHIYRVERLDARGQIVPGVGERDHYSYQDVVATLPYWPTPALAIQSYIRGRQQNVENLRGRIDVAETDIHLAEEELRKGQGHT